MSNGVFCGALEGGLDLKLSTHLQLVPRLRMSGAIPPVCHIQHVVHKEQLCFDPAEAVEP
jgi:hypothetical protein